MSNLDDYKKGWQAHRPESSGPSYYERQVLETVFKRRIRRQKRISMQYFWASFTLQIIVYALLSHVFIRYWGDRPLQLAVFGGVLLYLPFTFMLMRKYKQMAVLAYGESSSPTASVREYVEKQHALLSSFYRFKRRYEWFLVPLSSVLLTWAFFRIYLPGGVSAYPGAAAWVLGITLVSCALAIRAENKKHFRQPLEKLEEVMEEFGNRKGEIGK